MIDPVLCNTCALSSRTASTNPAAAIAMFRMNTSAIGHVKSCFI
ncbi:MAG: hypothetical protein WDM81_15990 [Rhizomicrobium sp.]